MSGTNGNDDDEQERERDIMDGCCSAEGEENGGGASTTARTSSSSTTTTTRHGAPTEGMMCLATMEDITVEDENYGAYAFVRARAKRKRRHPDATKRNRQQMPKKRRTFPILILYCFSSFPPAEISVEYQSYPSMKWRPALFERCVVEQLLETQFHQFVERVKTTDCQAELKRLLAKGPPVYLEPDKHAMPLAEPDTDTHICMLWFAARPHQEVPAKLDGALEGADRDELWTELKQFVVVEGKEEGDDDDEEEDGEENGNDI